MNDRSIQESNAQVFSKEELLELDRKFVWHHMSVHNPNPMIFVSGKNSSVTDIDGKTYIDGMSGLWCVNVGYGREEIAKAAADQMVAIPYVPMSQGNVPSILLAEKINEWLGGNYRIFYSNSGSDANEVAFKIARQYHQQNGEPSRFKFISRYRAYHGNSMGALSATGQAHRKTKYEPLSVGFHHVAPPYCYRCPFGKTYGECGLECAKAYEDLINYEGADTIAGIIMEPVITGGGVIVPPPEYLTEVRNICDRHGILLIVDEVICGFGRSGKPFGHQNFNIKPDIITMAKGMTSAYTPLSATAIRSDLYEQFKKPGADNHFRHVNTFGGNPASCAVALKNLEIIEQEKLIDRAAYLGNELRKKLDRLIMHKNVGDIRSFGFILGIELVEDKESKIPASPEKVMKIIKECKENGLIIGKNGDTVPGFNNILTLSPPFTTTDEEIDFIVTTLLQAFAKL
ncbi:aspartate aminotransferase family protein [Gottfriedia luciferensis]|uniref:aspartate aminotransferase family protein n=1 Tax=Gottfriedia luciferensis TaxID=178774 RepID=UPI0022870F66|nr:aspartate aminotransferase family protein [Gottfriedia luciferensis]